MHSRVRRSSGPRERADTRRFLLRAAVVTACAAVAVCGGGSDVPNPYCYSVPFNSGSEGGVGGADGDRTHDLVNAMFVVSGPEPRRAC